jgi:HEAT repeat protein
MKIRGIAAAGAALLLVAVETADAQSLASRISAAGDGKVRMTFAARDGICGFHNGISTRPGNRSTWSRERSQDVEYDVECSDGPARIVVDMSGGQPVALKAYVGGRWRSTSGATDIGAVGTREATSWLLAVAGRGDSKVASSAIFAATLADSVDMGPTLHDFARDGSKPAEAREQAIFWMSQIPEERVVGYLEGLLRDSREERIQDKAIFALSQHESDRSKAILRDFAVQEGGSEKLRGQAIFWLGQGKRGESPEYLRSLYSRVRTEALKDKVIFAVSQQKGAESGKWLLDLVSNRSEPMAMRKKALFWAGQGSVSTEMLASLYAKMTEREMKDQMIFALSQKKDAAAIDKLMDIARNDADREARRKAMFWLGQSKDPRVATMLLDIINK